MARHTRIEIAFVFEDKFPAEDDEGMRLALLSEVKECLQHKLSNWAVDVKEVVELLHIDQEDYVKNRRRGWKTDANGLSYKEKE